MSTHSLFVGGTFDLTSGIRRVGLEMNLLLKSFEAKRNFCKDVSNQGKGHNVLAKLEPVESDLDRCSFERSGGVLFSGELTETE